MQRLQRKNRNIKKDRFNCRNHFKMLYLVIDIDRHFRKQYSLVRSHEKTQNVCISTSTRPTNLQTRYGVGKTCNLLDLPGVAI